jgi:hypothetical protein
MYRSPPLYLQCKLNLNGCQHQFFLFTAALFSPGPWVIQTKGLLFTDATSAVAA